MESAPIFIQGILPRSGTNLLFNLLRLHPDCEVPDPIWEDWSLETANLLVDYAQATYELWARNPNWGVYEALEGEFLRSLGGGVLSFLTSHAQGQRLVTKTPSVKNLGAFCGLFPRAYLLIVVRDGRDVVESSARSFGWDRDEVARLWAEAARTILAFDQAHRGDTARHMIVRYEDLAQDIEGTLYPILDFVGLDAAAYDFEAAQDLPVYGSSTFRGGATQVHWEPVARTQDFKPVRRWADWSRRQHERFNAAAGDLLPALGYELQAFPDRRWVWDLYNRIADRAATLRIRSRHHIEAAFAGHQAGDQAQVRRHVPPAVVMNPSWLANRGVWSIFVRALIGRV
ncbi:MAG: sulfotransferase [Anaerolineae bacterium]